MTKKTSKPRPDRAVEMAAAKKIPAAGSAELEPQKQAPTSKVGQLVGMLKRPEGMTIAQACEATGWQAHSVRGAISGAIGKGLGLKATSEKNDGVRTYRLPA